MVSDHPLTVEELQKEVDPDDSPWIRLCVNDDGSGAIEFITPADPDAEIDPDMAEGPFATAEPLIKDDKGSCE